MVLGTIAIFALGQQSVYLRVKAPPETKAEYRTTIRVEAGPEGDLDAFIYSGRRILSNVRTNYRCRDFIQESKVNATGMFTGQAHNMRDLKGQMFDLNRTARNETASVWNEGKKVSVNLTEGYTDLVFPEQPLVVGSTWTQDQLLGGQWVRVNYEFVGFGSSNISRTALVQGVIADGQGLESREPNQYVVDLETGLVRRASGKYAFTMNDLSIVTSFRVQRATLIVPPPAVLNKQPVKKSPAKPAKKPSKRKPQ